MMKKLFLIMMLLTISITNAMEVAEDLNANVAPEIATQYIGSLKGIWPHHNETGLEIRQHFKENGRIMNIVSLREGAIFGIYDKKDAEELTKIIDPSKGWPLLNSVLGGPFSMDDSAYYMIVYDEDINKTTMYSWPRLTT